MVPERFGFRSDIEGLRGAAILLVVAFHAGVSWLAGGYVGVDVFFVISGYLITGLLGYELASTGRIDLADFYARRARRLLPAFLVVLLATVGMVLWLYAPIDQAAIASDARAVALHSGNVLFARSALDYHATSDNPFLHTWSLAVEEQFYVVWPLLFVLFARTYGNQESKRKRLTAWVVAAGAVSLAASLWLTGVAQPWAFFGMPTRIWEFAAGGLVSLGLAGDTRLETRGGWLQGAGLAAIAIAGVAFHDATPYPGFAALLPVLGTVALLVGGHRAPNSLASRALGSRVPRWLGRMAYAWYLWHWPLVGLGAVLDWNIGVGGRLAWSVAALGLAVLTHYFVEEPVRRGKLLRVEPQSAGALALIATGVALLLAHGAMLVGRARASSPEQRRFVAARTDGMRHDCWASLLTNATAPCIFGDTHAQSSVVLLGDSHAEHWLPALDAIGRRKHWKVVAMVKPACPVADMRDFVSARLKRPYSECGEWRRAMLRRILALRPTIVVLSSYDHYMPADGERSRWRVTPESWRDGLRRTYTLLSRAGLSTVVIRGTPNAGFDAPSCLSRQASGAPFQLRSCSYDLREALMPPAVSAQNAAASGLPRIGFVDMTDQFCAARDCPVTRGGTVIFRDGNHITASFSRATAPVLGARIERAIAGFR